MSPPPGAGGVGLGVPIPHNLVMPLPISALPRSRRNRVPPPICPPPASIGSVASVDTQASPAANGPELGLGHGQHTHGEVEVDLNGGDRGLTSTGTGVDEVGSICTVEEDDPPGGKKRKVPIPLVPGSEADVESGRDGADRNPPRSAREDTTMAAQQAAFPIIRRLPRSASAKLLAQRRALFQKRKAGMVALYLDAQGAVEAKRADKDKDKGDKSDKDKGDSGKDSAGAKKDSASASKDSSDSGSPSTRPMPLPDVSAFERLLPVLEDIDTWPPDAPGWRDGDDAARPVPRRTLERWRTGFARRKRMRSERVPVVRGGWAPEGSFELDIPTAGECAVLSWHGMWGNRVSHWSHDGTARLAAATLSSVPMPGPASDNAPAVPHTGPCALRAHGANRSDLI